MIGIPSLDAHIVYAREHNKKVVCRKNIQPIQKWYHKALKEFRFLPLFVKKKKVFPPKQFDQ